MIKATKINLFSLSSVPMKTFHMTWLAFFLCFFGWFGIAPLMPVIKKEFALTQAQVGNTIIASVAITIFARLFIGWLCDRIGPRKAYGGILLLGAIPVATIGFANSYESFLAFRLAIGVIGASFVITQYHTSVMFAPNVVGTANATTAGWGNLGGGVTQMVMPLIFGAMLFFGMDDAAAWRWAMVVPGVVLFLMGFAYLKVTKDYPTGNIKPDSEEFQQQKLDAKKSFLVAIKDPRVWALFVIYGACFGIELTINNIAAIYYVENFTLDLKTAGFIAGLFGLMNIFARTMGGIFGDKAGNKFGLKGRVYFLALVLAAEGLALMLFSQMAVLWLAIGSMIVFSLCVQMAEGATYAVVPFINKKALGSISGIVGAGGNAGAVAAGFLFKSGSYQDSLFILGILVLCSSALTIFVRFSEADNKAAAAEMTRLKSLELEGSSA